MIYYDKLEDCIIEVLSSIKDVFICKVKYDNTEEFKEFDKSFIDNEIELGNFLMQK